LVVGAHEVEIAVAVEVAQREAPRHSPDWDGRGGREGAIAVVAQHRDAVAGIVADYEIDVAVAVEVAGFDFARAIPDRDGRLGRETATAVAEQNRDVVADIVGDEKVEVAVTVDVGRSVGNGVGARGKGRTGAINEQRHRDFLRQNKASTSPVPPERSLHTRFRLCKLPRHRQFKSWHYLLAYRCRKVPAEPVGQVCPTVISRWISSDLNPIASAARTRGNTATS
jgi:hypothetical protein